MTRLLSTLGLLAALAACGADGEPTAPDAAKTGVSISGTARIGVAGKL
jgi:predicted small lipoprotein YifL